MNSISIVKGNEARVIVNLTRILATSAEELPLEVSEVKDLRVRLIPRAGASVSLAANVYSENSVIVKVPVLPCGTYAMEVTGERNLMRIASRELCVLRVVYDNSLATVPSGEIEGSKSYDIDMTMVLYTNEVYQVDEEVTEDGKNTPRTSAVYKTIQMYGEAAQQAAEELNVMHENISKLAGDVSDVVESEEERAKAEEERLKAETSRAQAETDRVNEFAELKSASEKATTSANSAASAANSAAAKAEAATTTANKNEQARQKEEAERVKAEIERANAESERVKDETSRANAESARAKAETDRTNAWAAWFENATTGVKALWNTWFDNVKSLWGTLKSDVENATTLAVEAAENANNSANHPPYVGEDLYWYVWNNETKSYDKTDKYSKGDGFSVTKTFSSVTEMNAYVNPSTATTDNPILKLGDFVLISSDVEDEDNSKLYVVQSVTPTKISYGFLTDMSGARGFTGHTPQLSVGTITTGAAGTLANISLTENGTDANGNPKYLINFVIPKGDKGDAFTYDDFTDEQIAGLQKPATDAAAVALSAAETANNKATLADNAATNANEKASLADTAAAKANNAATNADNKATLANTAAENANEKAELANDAATTVNALVDAWVQTNPVAGMSRIDGDSDPAAEKLYGSAQVREIGKHLRLKVVKDGKVVKTAAAGRLTTATNGDDIAIDGTEGDIMLGFDCDTYLLKASEEIDSVKHNMMGVSLAPASWQGHVSKKFKPWAITPCETVVAKLSDDTRSQAHCIYNTSVAGSFGTPTDFFNEKLYTNGGGLRTVDLNGLSVIQMAQAKNTDAATCVPYMGSYYEFEEFMRVMMYSECGTKNTTAKNLFGVGCTTIDPTSSTTFYDSAVSADSGIKIITTEGAESYLNIWGSLKLNSSATATQALNGINAKSYNFIPNLEEQRLLDGIAKAGLISHIGNYLAVFSYDDSGNVVVTTDGSVNPATGSGMAAGKRYYVVRNVPNCEGMADGVMTAVINCYVKLTCKSGMCDASGNDISGASVIFKFSLGIYRGWSIPMRGTFRFISGMAYTIQNNGGTYKNAFYCCESPEDMQPLTNTTIYGLIGTEFNALKGMRKFISEGIAFGEGWAKNADYNFSLFCYLSLGAGVHTHECAYIWRSYCWGQGSNGKPADGYACVNAAFGGCSANRGAASASTLDSVHALSHSYSNCAGAFAAYPLADA